MYIRVVSRYKPVLVRNVLNASGICITVRVTLEEFALSTCVRVVLHGPAAVRNTRCASTERLSTLIKSAETLFALPGSLHSVTWILHSICFATSEIFISYRAIKIFDFDDSM